MAFLANKIINYGAFQKKKFSLSGNTVKHRLACALASAGNLNVNFFFSWNFSLNFLGSGTQNPDFGFSKSELGFSSFVFQTPSKFEIIPYIL